MMNVNSVTKAHIHSVQKIGDGVLFFIPKHPRHPDLFNQHDPNNALYCLLKLQQDLEGMEEECKGMTPDLTPTLVMEFLTSQAPLTGAIVCLGGDQYGPELIRELLVLWTTKYSKAANPTPFIEEAVMMIARAAQNAVRATYCN